MALVLATPDPGGACLSAGEGLAIGAAFTAEVVPSVRPMRRRKDIYAIVLADLNSILSRYENAAQVMRQYPQLEPLIIWLLVNRFRISAFTVLTALPSLTADEAAQIGMSFTVFLALGASPALAVEEWVLKYPALVEFDSAHAFFRPMMNEVAKKHMADAMWAASFRLFFGATLSILDMVSDIIVIIAYKGAEEFESVGNLLLRLLIANITVQLFLVYAQNRNGPGRVLFREIIYTVTCVKVGVDAYRVATGAEPAPYNAITPKVQLSKSNDAAIRFDYHHTLQLTHSLSPPQPIPRR
jgi:hypothetical protein